MTSAKETPSKNILQTILFFAVVLTVGCCLLYFGWRSDAVTVAKSIKSGVVTADEVGVAFEGVSGKLISRKIQESDHVNAGDLLLVLNPEDRVIALKNLEASLAALRAQLAQEESALVIARRATNLKETSEWRRIEQLKASVTSAKAQEVLARTEYNRVAKLIRTQAVSQSQYDNALSALTSAESALVRAQKDLVSATIGAADEDLKKLESTGHAEGMKLEAIENERLTNDNRENAIAALKAQIAQKEAEIEQAKLNLSRLELKAPQSGKILKLLYEEGEMIGAAVPAVLLETDRKYVDFYVNETLAGGYKPGSEVSLYIPALDKTVKGTVRFTTVVPSFADLRNTREKGQSDLTNFQVRVYLEDAPQLLTGMTAEVK
jgi:HlyD family secretion protein